MNNYSTKVPLYHQFMIENILILTEMNIALIVATPRAVNFLAIIIVVILIIALVGGIFSSNT